MNKYNAKRTVVDGISFHSKAEAARYSDLKLLERAGVIFKLELQPAFPCVVNKKKICVYKADFKYHLKNGKWVIEDVKGYRTQIYKIKKKLVEALYGIEITEIQV